MLAELEESRAKCAAKEAAVASKEKRGRKRKGVLSSDAAESATKTSRTDSSPEPWKAKGAMKMVNLFLSRA